MILTGVWSILGAALSMGVKDATGTLMVVFEARNRGHLAGVMDALNDLAVVLTTYFGAGEIILHGLTGHSLLVLVTICTVSYVGTRYWTGFGNRLTNKEGLCPPHSYKPPSCHS